MSFSIYHHASSSILLNCREGEERREKERREDILFTVNVPLIPRVKLIKQSCNGYAHLEAE